MSLSQAENIAVIFKYSAEFMKSDFSLPCINDPLSYTSVKEDPPTHLGKCAALVLWYFCKV